MYTASRMQDMVQIRERNVYFATNLLLQVGLKNVFGALGVESLHGGAIRLYVCLIEHVKHVTGMTLNLQQSVNLWPWISRNRCRKNAQDIQNASGLRRFPISAANQRAGKL